MSHWFTPADPESGGRLSPHQALDVACKKLPVPEFTWTGFSSRVGNNCSSDQGVCCQNEFGEAIAGRHWPFPSDQSKRVGEAFRVCHTTICDKIAEAEWAAELCGARLSESSSSLRSGSSRNLRSPARLLQKNFMLGNNRSSHPSAEKKLGAVLKFIAMEA